MAELFIHWDDIFEIEFKVKDTYNQYGGGYYQEAVSVKRIDAYPDKVAIERAISFSAKFGMIENTIRYKLLNQLRYAR